MRTRYWGLYDYADKGWLAHGKGGSYGWKLEGKIRRQRFASLSDALKQAARVSTQTAAPRPFYVITKPRKLPPEAQAVIDAVKRYDACGVGWKAVGGKMKWAVGFKPPSGNIGEYDQWFRRGDDDICSGSKEARHLFNDKKKAFKTARFFRKLNACDYAVVRVKS